MKRLPEERHVLRNCTEQVWRVQCRKCGAQWTSEADRMSLDVFVKIRLRSGWRASIERGALCPDCAEKAGLRK